MPQLFTKQSLECEKDITEKELLEALKSMSNDKSPGTDDLTKKFSKHFGLKHKKTLFCVSHSFDKEDQKKKQLLN